MEPPKKNKSVTEVLQELSYLKNLDSKSLGIKCAQGEVASLISEVKTAFDNEMNEFLSTHGLTQQEFYNFISNQNNFSIAQQKELKNLTQQIMEIQKRVDPKNPPSSEKPIQDSPVAPLKSPVPSRKPSVDNESDEDASISRLMKRSKRQWLRVD